MAVPRENVAPKRALIVKFGQIGDVIMALPAVRLLYEQGYEIHWVCGKAVYPLLKCYSWISLIPIDDKAILRGGLLQRAKNITSLWSKVVFKGYDLCATLYYDKRFHLLAWPIQARRRLALSAHTRETSLLAGRHHTDEYVRVLLGKEDGCRELSTSPVRPDLLPQSSWKFKDASRRVAIVPGGTSNVLGQQVLRRWPVERYVALAHQLLDRGWEVVLLGGPEDNWVKPYFESLAVTDCIDALSLPEVIRACDACDAVVSHDTGPIASGGVERDLFDRSVRPNRSLYPRAPKTICGWHLGGAGICLSALLRWSRLRSVPIQWMHASGERGTCAARTGPVAQR